MFLQKFNMLRRIFNYVVITLAIVFGIVTLLLVVKGDIGSGLSQAGKLTHPGQVFESSIARGRYSLVLSVVDDHRLDFTKTIANFAAPDASITKTGNFVSI